MLLIKRDFIFSTILVVMTTLFCSHSSYAINYEPIENIKNIAKNFAMNTVAVKPDETIEVKFPYMDSKLKLPLCSTEITAALPLNSNKDEITSVELTCNGLPNWHTLVPVNVTVMTKVIVASQNIMAKERISENNIELASSDKKRLYSGFFTDTKEIIGQEATHMIPAGTVLSKRNLQQPLLVTRNQVVDLIVRKNSMTISMRGVAKTDGRQNELIKVYNPSSKRTIDAIVVASGKAEVA